MFISTRRDFLATTSAALAGSIIGTRGLLGQPLMLTAADTALPATAFFATTITPADLRAFAVHAIDAAKSAGASYADVRVAEQIRLEIGAGENAALIAFQISPFFMYGVRVIVDGAWGFIHGVTPSKDALATAARNAVASTRGYANVNRARVELAPVPVVTGEWDTPTELDPFTVPLGDQAALLSACFMAGQRVRNASFASWSNPYGLNAVWKRERRVYASSEGSVVTQTLRTFEPEANVVAGLPMSDTKVHLPALWPAAGGYECLTRANLQDDIKAVTEDAARYLSLPARPMEVGRYPTVFDGTTMGSVLSRTLGRALEMDRALGYEIGASGGSYLEPPEEMLGKIITNPLLTVTASRAAPSVTSAKWDDEGVECRELPLITAGRLSNYIMSRETVSGLHNTMTSQDSPPPRLPGCSVAPNADDPVTVRVPMLTIAPGTARASLDDLCKEISHGVLIRYGRYMAVDHKLASCFIPYPGVMLEIEKGKAVRRLAGNAPQFITPRLWKQSLTALGDAHTVCPAVGQLDKGMPESRAWYSAQAPAGLFKEVDIISTRV